MRGHDDGDDHTDPDDAGRRPSHSTRTPWSAASPRTWATRTPNTGALTARGRSFRSSLTDTRHSARRARGRRARRARRGARCASSSTGRTWPSSSAAALERAPSARYPRPSPVIRRHPGADQDRGQDAEPRCPTGIPGGSSPTPPSHGKEGVVGSSPTLGSIRKPRSGGVFFWPGSPSRRSMPWRVCSSGGFAADGRHASDRNPPGCTNELQPAAQRRSTRAVRPIAVAAQPSRPSE